MNECINCRKEAKRKGRLCPECTKKSSTIWWPQKEWRTRYYRKWKYGVTQEQYDAQLEAQGGVCAICKREQETKRAFCVDHVHATGQFRGVLCHGCNLAIGNVKESATTLREAARYLSAFKKKTKVSS